MRRSAASRGPLPVAHTHVARDLVSSMCPHRMKLHNLMLNIESGDPGTTERILDSDHSLVDASGFR